jgi:hypothetical protein
MQFGADITDRRCARCYQQLVAPLIYRDGELYHQKCFDEGARQLANAQRLAQGLAPVPPPSDRLSVYADYT